MQFITQITENDVFNLVKINKSVKITFSAVDGENPHHGRFHHGHHGNHGNGGGCMEFTRSSAVCGSGITSVFFNVLSRREQINQVRKNDTCVFKEGLN